MPHREITCECGETIEEFISISEDITGKVSCPNCPRLIRYESPASKAFEETEVLYEAGELGEKA